MQTYIRIGTSHYVYIRQVFTLTGDHIKRNPVLLITLIEYLELNVNLICLIIQYIVYFL